MGTDESADLALLTPHEIQVLEEAQQDLHAWILVHRGALVIAGAREAAEMLADEELDPLWVAYWRRRDIERKRQSAGVGGQDAPPLAIDARGRIQ